MYTFQSVVEEEQQNGEHQKNIPSEENENPDSSSNQEQGMDKSTKICKEVERHPIAVGV